MAHRLHTMTAIQLDGEFPVMRRQPNILASGALGALAGVALVAGIIAFLSMPASAQVASSAPRSQSEMSTPYGMSYGQDVTPYEANNRGENGNRVVINGLLEGGTGVAFQGQALAQANAQASSFGQAFAGGSAQGQAVGNQINVITQGNYNTVVVNAQQTNTGNQTAVLNGKLNLDD
jgi:holdfast attachment protein HfaA